MHGLPEYFDGGFFLGRTLEQICVTANTISLHFDRDIMVTIEGEYSCYLVAGSTGATACHVPAFHTTLPQLLERAVTNVAGSTDGTLRLTFVDGYGLAMFDNPNYEAYHVKHGELVITV